MMMDEQMIRAMEEYENMSLNPSLEACAMTAPSMMPRPRMAPWAAEFGDFM